MLEVWSVVVRQLMCRGVLLGVVGGGSEGPTGEAKPSLLALSVVSGVGSS